MNKVPYSALPFATRLATMASFFTCWILFAEFVIDRQGFDAFLPYYRVGYLCPYELAVTTILVFLWVRLHRAEVTEERLG